MAATSDSSRQICMNGYTLTRMRVMVLMAAALLSVSAEAGTSPVHPGREAETAKKTGPGLPGSQLPEHPMTEPHYAGKRSIMKAGMNNLKAGSLLRERNKLDPGVATLPSGLQYRVIKEGEGQVPKKADIVEVYFEGKLVDGTVFASTPRPGKPAAYRLNDVIKGWREALRQMPVGSKWQLFVPPELGYGVQGLPPHVGPGATLIYELELAGIRPGKTGKAADSAKTDGAAATE